MDFENCNEFLILNFERSNHRFNLDQTVTQFSKTQAMKFVGDLRFAKENYHSCVKSVYGNMCNIFSGIDLKTDIIH